MLPVTAMTMKRCVSGTLQFQAASHMFHAAIIDSLITGLKPSLASRYASLVLLLCWISADNYFDLHVWLECQAN